MSKAFLFGSSSSSAAKGPARAGPARSQSSSSSSSAPVRDTRVGKKASGPRAVAPAVASKKASNVDSEKERIDNLVKRQKYPVLVHEQSVISVYSYGEMKRIKTVDVTVPAFEGTGSINDDRMGSVEPSKPCGHCHVYDCPGHYGFIDFGDSMIYNPLFVKDYVVPLLKVLCRSCGRLMFDETYFQKERLTRRKPSERLAALAKKSAGVTCVHKNDARREAGEGAVRPCTPNPAYESAEAEKTGVVRYKSSGSNSTSPMDIADVYNLFDHMHRDDLKLLGFNSDSHPRNFIMRGILVAPCIARPPMYAEGMRREDQLSEKYKGIVEAVQALKNARKTEDALQTDTLYGLYRQFIFKEDKESNSGIEYHSIILRIQGKKALLRDSLMGKRNNYTGRTVAGPDPSLRFGEMSVPDIWATTLIKKERVTTLNKTRLERMMAEGKITHVIDRHTEIRYGVNKHNRIAVGDTVCRHMRDGDWAVVNRQPTLTKNSMMAYQLRLKNQLTIGNHLSVCAPMNLDFDGDELNLWIAVDNMVRAECIYVMNSVYNIMSESQNKPVMGLVMNSVTSAYLLNQTEKPMSEVLFNSLLNLISTKDSFPTLFRRLEKFGVHPRSGPAIFSALLPPDFHLGDDSQFIDKANFSGNLADLPRGATPVKIREGVLITGKVTKSHVGAAHRSIIQELWHDYGAERTAAFLTDAPWVLNKWIFESGFSVSLRDCVNFVTGPDGREINRNLEVLDSELAQLRVSLKALGPKSEDPLEEKFRQQKILENVDLVSAIGVRLADEVLTESNRIGIMTAKGAGTKGDKFNLSQIMSAVGQQNFNGDRIQPHTMGNTRTLCMFDPGDERPESQGLVVHSFFHGVRPEELFFMHEAGRQALMDTALNTARIGSIQHKLIKATEGIIIAYNGAIVNTNGTVFSTSSNCGFSVASVMNVPHPTKDSFTFFADIGSEVSKLNSSVGFYGPDITRLVAAKAQAAKARLPIPAPFSSLDYPVLDYRKKPRPASDVMPLSNFETARLIGTRATQLDYDSKTTLSAEQLGDLDESFLIAQREYTLGLCPVYVIRKHPSGFVEIVKPTPENI